jgi:hypothetical protein
VNAAKGELPAGEGRPKLEAERANRTTRPKRKKCELCLLFFYILFIFKTIFKMDFESKSNKIKTTPHNKTNATA